MCVGAPGVSVPPDQARVWDLPTRLFHWALVALVAVAFITETIGGNAMAWHGRVGLAILGLLAFRIVWGFTGSTYARFTHFVRGPTSIRAYLRGEWQGLGHNPLGAFSVLVLLAILLAQAGTGLFSNDDIAYRGFLAVLVSDDTSSTISGIHEVLSNALIVLLVLHVGAIAFHARVKKHNLVKPMITGWTEGKPCQSAKGGGTLAFIAAVLIATGVAWAASGALLPAPVPMPATSAPTW